MCLADAKTPPGWNIQDTGSKGPGHPRRLTPQLILWVDGQPGCWFQEIQSILLDPAGLALLSNGLGIGSTGLGDASNNSKTDDFLSRIPNLIRLTRRTRRQGAKL